MPAIADAADDQDDHADIWDLLGDIAEAAQAQASGSDGEFKCECSEAGSADEDGGGDGDHGDVEPPPQPQPPPPEPPPQPGPSPSPAPAPGPSPVQEDFKLIAAEDRHSMAQAIIKAARGKVQAYKAAVRQADAQEQAVGLAQVSLVRSEGRVGFVSWTTPETLQGVNVEIDESNKAISQCGWARPVSYFDAQILIHSVATIYEYRFPKHLRPLIPDWCMAIFIVEQAHQSSGPYTTTKRSVKMLSCIQCACVKDLGASAQRLREAEPSIFGCRSCGSAWHEECIYDSGSDRVQAVGSLDEFMCFGCL